jgi:hypothetical protein
LRKTGIAEYRVSFHFSIHTAISRAPSGWLVRPLGGRGARFAKRRLDDHAPIGGAGAPPSRQVDYFRIDPEMESLTERVSMPAAFAPIK